ncbi:dihydrolipoyl dehydrogenase [Halanaerobaculum tunisiense]
MVINLKLTELEQGKVIRNYKKTGEKIETDDKLFDIEGDKNNITVTANNCGTIKNIEVKEGQTVQKGDTLAKIKGEQIKSNNTNSKSNNNDDQNNNFDYFNSLSETKEKEIKSDITIIGGGPGGYVAAIKAAKLGANVTLIEKNTVGGTCLNRGCIPTKSLVKSAKVYKNLKHAEKFGCQTQDVSVDMKQVIKRKDTVVNQLVSGIKHLLDSHGVKVINGKGRLLDKETISVQEANTKFTIKSDNIIIATGSKVATPPIKGLDTSGVINSAQALNLDNLPDEITIIGGGVIGMEFAFIYKNLGVEVTVIEYLEDVLSTFDTDVSQEINRIAQEKGIKLYTEAKVEEVIASEDNKFIVSFTKNEEQRYVTTNSVLTATGRKPYFKDLGVENLDIKLNQDRQGIKVNDKMQTNIPNIYAIGDVTNKMFLAHVASHQGIIAVKNIMGEEVEMDYSTVPGTVFTDPEIAMVGITEKQAKNKGLNVEIGQFPFAANGKVLTLGDKDGFIKLIKDKDSDKIIGGTIIGAHATDLIAEVTLAIENELTAKDVIETIHAHPTTSEVVHEGALAVEGGALHFAE